MTSGTPLIKHRHSGPFDLDALRGVGDVDREENVAVDIQHLRVRGPAVSFPD